MPSRPDDLDWLGNIYPWRPRLHRPVQRRRRANEGLQPQQSVHPFLLPTTLRRYRSTFLPYLIPYQRPSPSFTKPSLVRLIHYSSVHLPWASRLKLASSSAALRIFDVITASSDHPLPTANATACAIPTCSVKCPNTSVVQALRNHSGEHSRGTPEALRKHFRSTPKHFNASVCVLVWRGCEKYPWLRARSTKRTLGNAEAVCSTSVLTITSLKAITKQVFCPSRAAPPRLCEAVPMRYLATWRERPASDLSGAHAYGVVRAGLRWLAGFADGRRHSAAARSAAWRTKPPRRLGRRPRGLARRPAERSAAPAVQQLHSLQRKHALL